MNDFRELPEALQPLDTPAVTLAQIVGGCLLAAAIIVAVAVVVELN